MQLFENNASSTLASSISDVAATLTVATATGDRFPAVNGADPDEYCLVTLEDTSGNIEIVKCTARTGGADVLTITRAQEGTTARAFTGGDRVELRITQGTLENFIQRVDDPVAITSGGTGANTAAAARTALGLAIGTNVQAYDAELAALAGLTSAADKGIHFTGAGTSTTHDLTAVGRTLIGQATQSLMRTTGLGLGTMATQADSAVAITGGTVVGITDLAIADGGTGASTAAAAFSALKQAASDTATGVVELATNVEALAGSDTTRAVTSAGLASSKSLTANGHMKLPGGLILQWGNVATDAAGLGTITYPVAFSSACWGVWGTDLLGNSSRYMTADTPGTSSVSIYCQVAVSTTFCWFAVGL
jgi:hypothetical protein